MIVHIPDTSSPTTGAHDGAVHTLRNPMSQYRRDNTFGATWFFTVVTCNRQHILCDEPVRVALRAAIADTRVNWPFAIDAWVLLPDHLHCIWTLPPNDCDFATRWNLIKRRTSRALKNNYFSDGLMTASKASRRELTFWQRRYWEHRIRDDRDFANHLDYIHYNPVKERGAGRCLRAAGQGRVIQRVRTPPRKAGQPPGSESLETDW